MENIEPKFISLMNDMTFKTLWVKGSVLTKKYLNDIITKIVGLDVSDFNLSSNELGLNNYKSIANKVDILLVNEDKKIKVNVELNKNYSKYLMRKNDTYIYKLAGETYAGNEKDKKYKYEINVTQVNINNFYNPENINISMNYYINADPINNLVKEGIKIYNLYLPKIKEMCYDGSENLYKDLEMFLAANYEEMELMVRDSKERKAVMEDLKKLGSDTEFVDLYDHDEFQEILREAEKEEAKEEALKEGLAKGLAEGIEQGIEKGIEQGIEKGREEGKIESAKKLIESGMPKKEVATILGIDINKI